MKKIAQRLTDLVGNTPLLELNNYSRSKDLKAHVIVKLEYFNPAGSVKDRTACRNDVRDTAQVHFKAFTVQQAVIAALNADHTVTLMQAGTDYGAHSSVHAGSITAACQHTNRFDLLFHTRDSLQFCLHLPSNITALSISTLLRALHLP